MNGVSIAKIVFLVIITFCAIISFGSGFVIGKKKYKNNDALRSRKLARIRAICFLIMMVMLLLIVIIK